LAHFKIKKITEISLQDIPSLTECVSWYMPKAEPEHAQLHHVLSRIHNAVKKGALWFLYEGKEVVGFLTATIAQDIYDERFCLAEDLFVMNQPRFQGQARRLINIGVAWVKRTGLKKIVFLTKRNPIAMCRFLSGKWQVESTVVSQEV
jgi:GNAT superfamily N-acetyltransferase